MVAFTEGGESSDDVITRGIAVVEWLVTEPVGEGVDAEGRLLNEADAENTGIDVATEEVTPEEAADEGREDDTHADDGLDEVAVLPDDDGVLIEVRNVGAAGLLRVLFHDHPADVRVKQTLADRVGILDSVGISVVGTMIPGPPSDGALYGTSAHGSEVDLERCGGLVRAMSPETVITYIGVSILQQCFIIINYADGMGLPAVIPRPVLK